MPSTQLQSSYVKTKRNAVGKQKTTLKQSQRQIRKKRAHQQLLKSVKIDNDEEERTHVYTKSTKFKGTANTHIRKSHITYNITKYIRR